jgi:hypothetical protein
MNIEDLISCNNATNKFRTLEKGIHKVFLMLILSFCKKIHGGIRICICIYRFLEQVVFVDYESGVVY